MSDTAKNITDPIEARYAKLEEAKKRGMNPYAYEFKREHKAGDVQAKYKDLADGAETEDTVVVAGRIVAMRNDGMFIDIEDASGKIQIFCHKIVAKGSPNFRILCARFWKIFKSGHMVHFVTP